MSGATGLAIPFVAPAAPSTGAKAAAAASGDPDATLRTAIRMGTVKPGWTYSRTDAIELPSSTIGANGRPLNWGQYVLAKSKDVDVYRFTVSAGDRIRFNLDTWRVTTPWRNPDTGRVEMKSHQAAGRLALFDASGNRVKGDGGPQFVSLPTGLPSQERNRYTLQYTFRRAGVYYLAVSHTKHSAFNLQTGVNPGPPNGTASFGPYRLDARRV